MAKFYHSIAGFRLLSRVRKPPKQKTSYYGRFFEKKPGNFYQKLTQAQEQPKIY